jgi:ubiquinone/menaquinone biosynthesis C-methylase UbiE
MIKIKGIIFLFITVIILISDLIITPYEITYAYKPFSVFLGILALTYLDAKAADAAEPLKLRKLLYFCVTVLFVLALALNILLKQRTFIFLFIMGCFIQAVISSRRMKRAKKVSFDSDVTRYESAMPDIGFKIMSVVLFIRDMVLNHKKLLESVGIGKGCHVLDYGCGPGAWTIAASKIVRDEGMVYALDNHHLAIEAIEKKIKKYGISNIKTIYTNQGETNLVDKSVDYVMLIGVLHSVMNPSKLLCEIKRVMKDDGRLLLVSVHLGQKELIDMVSPMFTLEERAKQMYIMKKIT